MYYAPPSDNEYVSFDLRDGYHKFIKKDDSIKENLDDLLKWILLNKSKFLVQNQTKQQGPGHDECLHTDFICWRGLLTKLLCTPYENRDGWQIAVTKYNDTLYLCEYETAERVQQKERETSRQQEMSYWGFKFEQYLTAKKPGQMPSTDVAVNNNAAFCSVVRTRLHTHSLVFGGEVDCCQEHNGETKYVELKTSREMYHANQERNFKRFKLIKWWAQSFLIGVPKIVSGFRDDDGVVHRLEEFKTQDIPRYCQDIDNSWNPSVCLNFCDQFLQHIKDTVTTDDPRVSCVFTWYPRNHVRHIEYGTDSQYAFMPAWYYNPQPTLPSSTDTVT
ncbi:Decapping and exoribonuclease protein [Lamellibrachia satsuma]|nr:Decapping and exoribonuclease protein [Lamellibrachia satsuma]